MFCPTCGTPASEGAARCPRCGGPLLAGAPKVVVVHALRSPGLAAVLSFFWCGLGQIYNRQIAKGIMMMIAYAISAFMMYLLIGFITTPILWIWGIIDAYREADRFNREAEFG